MSKNSSPNAVPQEDAAAPVAVGGATSGQQGATPAHEQQSETGGNGGAGLTRNQAGPDVNAPDGVRAARDTSARQAAASHEDPRAAAPRDALGGDDTGDLVRDR